MTGKARKFLWQLWRNTLFPENIHLPTCVTLPPSASSHIHRLPTILDSQPLSYLSVSFQEGSPGTALMVKSWI
uniref:Uncharacterized protein n=1 Tax=Anguilla anguilla TaxID=7936 RepID=A0A0E9SLA2_ANGAN